MKRVLLVVVVLLLALPLAALAGARWYLTPDILRARANEASLRATGRALTIVGPVRLTWALHPKIEAEDVSFANPPGMSRPQMAHADRIEAALALWPLLARRAEVTRILVSRPDVRLERDAAGRPNWMLTPPSPPPANASAPPSPKPRLQLVVGAVELQGGALVWMGNGRTVSVELRTASYVPETGALAVTALLRGVPLELRGTAGPVSAAAVPLQLKLSGAGLEAEARGTSARPMIRVQAADLSTASTLAGVPVPAARDFHAQATLEFLPGQVMLHDLQATTVQGDVAGELSVALGSRPSVRGSLHSRRISLDGWTSAAMSAGPPTSATAAVAPAPPAAAPRQVIPDLAIPFASLRRGDADLHVSVADAVWRGRSFGAIDAKMVLQGGRLRLDPVSVQGAAGAMQGHVMADATATPPSVAVTARAPGLAAGPLLGMLGAPDGTGGTVDLELQLTGQGETTRALAATLGGHAGADMVDGEIENSWVASLFGDLLRKANLPVEPAGRSHVRCAAVRADFAQGQGRVEPLTVDTTRLKLDGTGVVDLTHETLDMHLRPQLRLGTGLSVPLRVTGPWQALAVALDAGALASGRVGVIVGGPPPPDTCLPALAAARGGLPGPTPALVTTPDPERRMRPADLLRGLLR